VLRHVAPLEAWRRAAFGVGFTPIAALEAILCRASDGNSQSEVRPVRGEDDFAPSERLPELPLLLAWFDNEAANKRHVDPHVQRQLLDRVQALSSLAQSWDASFVDKVSSLPPEKWPPSPALDAAARFAHLDPIARAAYYAARARALYGLGRTIAAVLAAIPWSGDTLRALYFRIGDLADQLSEDFPVEFGGGAARRLLCTLPLFDADEADTPDHRAGSSRGDRN
jgi:hypothetical protein